MPIQNEHEIQQLFEASQRLEQAAREARNSGDPREIQQIQEQLREVQNQIQDARGKAINGSGTSTQPLIDAQLRVEELEHTMKRAMVNLNAMDDEVQP
jgi:archaellum component FlaC